MIKFPADMYLTFVQFSTDYSATVKVIIKTSGNPDHKLSDDDRNNIIALNTAWRDRISTMRYAFERMDFAVSAKQVDRIGEHINTMINSSTLTQGDLVQYGHLYDELNRRLIDEVGERLILMIPTDEARRYEDPVPFGKPVLAKFPYAAYDIEEAAKCLALERNTACVMHLMRIVEAAVKAIALGVGMPTAAVKNIHAWEHLLKEVSRQIRENNATRIPAWIDSHAFFENTLAYLFAVKDAWRNPTMHLERKYTSTEADRIYTAVKNLMVALAEHLDEAGKFTA